MSSFDKKIFIGGITLLIAFLIFQQYLIRSSPPKTDDLLLEIIEIESKIYKLSERKDSIRNVVDSTHVKIVTNEKHYQERVNTIITQPLSADSAFITEYIRQYINKNDSTNLSGTREVEY